MMWLVALAAVVGLTAGYVAGYLHLVPKAFNEGVARADREWANYLENHIVGPTQTKHPRRG